jgi:hypothetical protein
LLFIGLTRIALLSKSYRTRMSVLLELEGVRNRAVGSVTTDCLESDVRVMSDECGGLADIVRLLFLRWLRWRRFGRWSVETVVVEWI